MTIQVNKPPAYLLLKKNKRNIQNLKAWITLLKRPFKKRGYAPNAYMVSSILSLSKNALWDKDKDLVEISFPSTISKLYGTAEMRSIDHGNITLSVGNRARIYFPHTDRHSVAKYQKMFSGKSKSIEGTYEQVAKFYFRYLEELMAIPKIPKGK